MRNRVIMAAAVLLTPLILISVFNSTIIGGDYQSFFTPLPEPFVELAPTSLGVQIERVEGGYSRGTSSSHGGDRAKYSFRGQDAVSVVRRLARYADMPVFGSELLPGGRYNITVETQVGGRAHLMKVLAPGLSEAFGLNVVVGAKPAEVLVLKCPDPSKLTGITKVSHGGRSQSWSTTSRSKRLRMTGTIGDLAGAISTIDSEPVVDETGLEAIYAVELSWSRRTGMTLEQALRNTGLTVNREMRDISAVFIERGAQDAASTGAQPETSASPVDVATEPAPE